MDNFARQIDPEAKRKSDAIDMSLDEEGQQLKKEYKMLLLGQRSVSSKNCFLNGEAW